MISKTHQDTYLSTKGNGCKKGGCVGGCRLLLFLCISNKSLKWFLAQPDSLFTRWDIFFPARLGKEFFLQNGRSHVSSLI
jgi:hypothetical protein